MTIVQYPWGIRVVEKYPYKTFWFDWSPVMFLEFYNR